MGYAVRTPRSTYLGPVGFPPGVKWLLIINCAVFVLYFFGVRAGYGDFFANFGLWPRAVIKFPALWQLVTYLFLHDPHGFMHILINMLILWMIGAELESGWGTRYFLKYYFLCGVGAGVCVVAVNALRGQLDVFTIGSSGAIYGLLLAYGVLYPDRIILFFFLFPLKAKYLVLIYGAISFLGSVGAGGGGVSHVAHLGGMVLGYLYLKRGRIAQAPWRSLHDRYQAWRLRRLKRKFEVYRRRHESGGRDRWIH